MKILQLCSKPPYPSSDGGAIAIHAITRGLIKAGHQVKVLAINTPKHFVKASEIDNDYARQTNCEFVFVDTTIKARHAFMNVFGRGSYNVSRFISADLERKLIEVLTLTSYDIVQLETLFVSPYVDIIRKHSKAKIVLRSHNNEHGIWERLAFNTGSTFKKIYLNFLARRLKKYETSMLNRYDGIATITANDASMFTKLGCKQPMTTIPFGIETETVQKAGTDMVENDSIFHLAAMNWQPNLQAVNWFIDKVWDLVFKKYPGLHLYLAGRYMPGSLLQLDKKNIHVVGEVPDAQRFMLSKNIMVVPLLSGGGMRIKIIEGMSLGKTIISTSIGAEGINYTDGFNILIANTPEQFATAIGKCIEDRSYCLEIGKNAVRLAREEYDNDKIVQKLTAFYKEL